MKTWKLFLIAIAFLFIASSANATGALVVKDSAGAPQAGIGEDFTISWTNATQDLNTDYNYLIRIREKNTSTYTVYDLNVNDANTDFADVNVHIVTLSGANCSTLGITATNSDWNIIELHSDVNKFDVNMAFPAGSVTNKELVIEAWEITNTAEVYTCGTSAAATASFIITPAIIVKGGNAANLAIGEIDHNFVVMGYGFETDENVTLKWQDANGLKYDLNMVDVNYSANDYADVSEVGDDNMQDSV